VPPKGLHTFNSAILIPLNEHLLKKTGRLFKAVYCTSYQRMSGRKTS
jgi:hypothetical protein